MEIRDQYGHVSQFDHIFEIMLNVDHFITDPNEIAACWISQGADPNKFDTEPDPDISALMGRDFTVDINLPIFTDTNLRLGGSFAQRLIQQGTLDWDIKVKVTEENEIKAMRFKSLPVDPYDGMPTYLTSNDSGSEAIAVYGKSYYHPALVFILESALWNAGLTVWPNIAALDFTPQYFKDLIVTIEVSHWIESDVTTFPINVVNYPVNNYAPVLCQPVEDQTFYLGEVNEYFVNFIDPDSFIFCMSTAPATTHTPAIAGAFRTDMDGLSYEKIINGLPNYPFCPWPDNCYEPNTNLFTWVPKFEDVYDVILACIDARGGSVFAELTIHCVKR